MILDWDDTLLCSSFLQANQFKLDSELYDLDRPLVESDSTFTREQREVALQLKELETCVGTLLRQATALLHQSVYIVTNAEHGWVQLSAAKFLPAIVPLLQSVTIISARSSFEHLFPAAPLKWKYFAFHSLLIDCGSGFFGRDGRPHVDKHVISLGDSHVEREAVRAVCKGVPNTKTKSVKFAQGPTIEQLRRQLELVNQCFAYITTHPADLDLQLTVAVNPAHQQQQAPASPDVPLAEDECMKSDAKDESESINSTIDLTKKHQQEQFDFNQPAHAHQTMVQV